MSTLLVVGCHTFSKLVNFEWVGMLVCWSVGAFGALDALEIGRV